VYLEVGSKKVFACALDWPGWCRSGKTEEAALEALAAYAPRYAPVAKKAGLKFPKSAGEDFKVTERVKGGATTDFGAPEKSVASDDKPITKAQAERIAALVEASWAIFDDVAAGAPASLRKGPRGGGRDRDKMIDHVLDAEAAYARKIGLRHKAPSRRDTKEIARARTETLETLRAARKPMPEQDIKSWPYRYAARRIAWHVLDHAWEMQDRSE
jgi:hypothetical protein